MSVLAVKGIERIGLERNIEDAIANRARLKDDRKSVEAEFLAALSERYPMPSIEHYRHMRSEEAAVICTGYKRFRGTDGSVRGFRKKPDFTGVSPCKEARSAFSYDNLVTDSVRECILSERNVLTWEKLSPDFFEEVENAFSDIQDASFGIDVDNAFDDIENMADSNEDVGGAMEVEMYYESVSNPFSDLRSGEYAEPDEEYESYEDDEQEEVDSEPEEDEDEPEYDDSEDDDESEDESEDDDEPEYDEDDSEYDEDEQEEYDEEDEEPEGYDDEENESYEDDEDSEMSSAEQPISEYTFQDGVEGCFDDLRQSSYEPSESDDDVEYDEPEEDDDYEEDEEDSEEEEEPDEDYEYDDDSEADSDSDEVDSEDDYEYDEDESEESEDVEPEPEPKQEQQVAPEEDDFYGSAEDSFINSILEKPKPINRESRASNIVSDFSRQIIQGVATPTEVRETKQVESVDVVKEVKEVYNIPTDLRLYVKQNKGVEISEALKYFSKRDIEKELARGRLIKKGTKLKAL